MMLQKRTLFCVFGVMQCVYVVFMLAAAQWCPIVVSNVSTFFMYML